jgi:murein DD-endopeptidase MepM/ murein hydrolase activator NlpD
MGVALLMSPDIGRLVSGQADLLTSAYEDRIAELRVEVDKLHSRRYAQDGDINVPLQELQQQQEVLLEQQQLVKQLAQKAGELGITTASLPKEDSQDGTGGVVKASVGAPAPSTADTGTDIPADADSDSLAKVGENMTRMMGESRLALAGLTSTATTSTDAIVRQLRTVGIQPKLPEGEDDAEDGMGGPLLPPVDGVDDDNSLVDEANATYLALARLKAAKGAVDTAPVHEPLVSFSRISSGFGNRTDPFTNGRAFHPGIDFAAPMGTTVLAAGAGTVSFVGQINGYGNVVEVTHESGIITRYGHLSAFLVKEGDTVDTGTPIARVGSTGRSTGPHLHFEIRRKDAAVDPAPFLSAGRRIESILGA